MDKVTEFQKRFNECLQYSNIKQTELAKAAKVSKQCISDYKAGKSEPSIDTLFIIGLYLDVSAEILLGFTHCKK